MGERLTDKFSECAQFSEHEKLYDDNGETANAYYAEELTRLIKEYE